MTDDEILGLVARSPQAILYFSAVWCGPCKTMWPLFDSMMKDYPDITMLKVDIDKHQPLGFVYQLMAVPAILFFKDGQKVGMKVGMQNMDDLRDYIEGVYEQTNAS